MSAVLSRLYILIINDISRDLDNTKILLYKLFFGIWLSNPGLVEPAKF